MRILALLGAVAAVAAARRRREPAAAPDLWRRAADEADRRQLPDRP